MARKTSVTNKIKKSKKKPEFLKIDEQELMMQQPNPRYPTGERNRLIMEFLLLTGTRVSELCDLRWKRINLNTGLIEIRGGKCNKDRTIYADDELLQHLRAWRERQDSVIGQTEYVFSTLKGDPVSPRYVQQMVKRYRDKAGIDKNITPHVFRHTYASDLYLETHDIILVQEALGHEDVSTTMIYTHLQDNVKKNEMNRAASARRAKWAEAEDRRKENKE